MDQKGGERPPETDRLRARRERRRQRVRRTEAVRLFSAEERQAILTAARGMPWTVRATGESYRGGFSGTEDPDFVYRLVRVLFLTGCHISVIPKLDSSAITFGRVEDYEGWLIEWYRPKNEERVGIPITLAEQDCLPWIRGFLDQSKPKTNGAYYHLLSRLSVGAGVVLGRPIKVNGLRFRHTAIVDWKRLGLSDFEVSKMAGCTPTVLNSTYLAVEREAAMARFAHLANAQFVKSGGAP